MTRKRIFTLVFSILFICSTVLGLGACGKKSGEDKAMAYAIAADPKCLDPQIANNHASFTAVLNMMEGLVRIDLDGNILPGCAKEWQTSADGKTYTFTLRDDIKWHTFEDTKDIVGENFDDRVTAHDFVFAFQRVVNVATNCPNVSDFFVIQNAQDIYEGTKHLKTLGVSAKGDFTLEIKLNEPLENFLQLLTLPAAMPCNEQFFNAVKGRYGLSNDHFLCNGPFYLSLWYADASLNLKRNPTYHNKDAVKPSTLTLLIRSDEKQNAENVKSGDVSLGLISETYADDFLGKDKYQKITNANETWGMFYNIHSSTLSDIRVRRALATLVNTDIIMDEDKSKANGLFPMSLLMEMKPYRTLAGTTTFPSYNAVKAKEEWAAAVNTLPEKIAQITFICLQEHENMMRTLIQEWQRNFGLSLDANIQVLEKPELIARVSTGDYEVAFAPMVADINNMSLFLRDFQTSPFATGSKEVQQKLKDYATVTTLNERVRVVKEMEQFIVSQYFVQPIYTENSYFILSENVWDIAFLHTVPYFAYAQAK